jgi:hypothetical protein
LPRLRLELWLALRLFPRPRLPGRTRVLLRGGGTRRVRSGFGRGAPCDAIQRGLV